LNKDVLTKLTDKQHLKTIAEIALAASIMILEKFGPNFKNQVLENVVVAVQQYSSNIIKLILSTENVLHKLVPELKTLVKNPTEAPAVLMRLLGLFIKGLNDATIYKIIKLILDEVVSLVQTGSWKNISQTVDEILSLLLAPKQQPSKELASVIVLLEDVDLAKVSAVLMQLLGLFVGQKAKGNVTVLAEVVREALSATWSFQQGSEAWASHVYALLNLLETAAVHEAEAALETQIEQQLVTAEQQHTALAEVEAEQDASQATEDEIAILEDEIAILEDSARKAP